MRAPLDPRFALVMAHMANAHADALPTMRRHATMFAEGCGRSYEEAVAEHYGLREAPELPQEPVFTPAPLLPQPEQSETTPTSQFQAFGATSGRVATLLRTDPSRGNRDIAREVGCSPTIVRRTRDRLGLAPAPHDKPGRMAC